jgi:hypothetical protein
MGEQEEDRSDQHQADRDPSEAPSGPGRWQSGRGLRPFGHHQHHRRHRDAGAPPDGGTSRQGYGGMF